MGTVIQMESEAEALGRAAAECDLWAQQPEVPYWDKAELVARAKRYRTRQTEILSAQAKPQRQHGGLLTGTIAAILIELSFAAAILISRYLWRIL